MIRSIFILSILFAGSVSADVGDIWVSPYSHTEHYRFKSVFDRSGNYKKYVNSHPSLGIEYQDAETKSIGVGIYRDSYGTMSAYVSRHWSYGRYVGATMGVLAGPSYKYTIVPFAGPEITAQIMAVKLSLAYLPGFGAPRTPNLAVFQVAINIR